MGDGQRGGKDCCSCEAAAEQYNCFTREKWSQKKKKWCCAKKQLGCPPKPAKQYNCFTRESWSQKKKKWCCAKKQLGCPPTPAPPNPAKQYNCFTRESWSQKKKKWCCAKKQLGCPPAVDCSDMQCAFDICPDGKGRRPVGKDCCSCEAAAEQYNCFTRESWSQ